MSVDYSKLEDQLMQIYKTSEFHPPRISEPRDIHIYSTSSSITCGIDKFDEMNQSTFIIKNEIQMQKQLDTSDVEFSNVFLAELQKKEKDVCDKWKLINELPIENISLDSNKQQTKLLRANVFPDSPLHLSLEMLLKRRGSKVIDEQHDLGSVKHDRRSRSRTVISSKKKIIPGQSEPQERHIKRRITNVKIVNPLFLEGEGSNQKNEKEQTSQ